MSCLFALAQVADGRGDHAEAAACLGPANSLAQLQRKSCGQSYDPDEHTRYVDRLIAAFTPALFARLGDVGDDSPQPVFVFGMPRSGTTLVEQVLASHSRAHGAGELPFVRRAMDSLPPAPDRPADDLGASLQALDAPGVRRLAGVYLDGVRAALIRQGCATEPARVVDKMPDNYVYLGLIALLFPRATLIHVRRDPRDVAFSCWLTQFRSIRWADDMEHLARRFQDNRRLMDHWRAALPGIIHEVSYERLVDDFEPEARRLVAACGLDWEPACLQFHQTTRAVRTASVAQVRQPIYRKSLARWKAYEPYLAALFERHAQRVKPFRRRRFPSASDRGRPFAPEQNGRGGPPRHAPTCRGYAPASILHGRHKLLSLFALPRLVCYGSLPKVCDRSRFRPAHESRDDASLTPRTCPPGDVTPFRPPLRDVRGRRCSSHRMESEMLFRLLSKLMPTARQRKTPPPTRPRRPRLPHLEELEARLTPNAYLVNVLGDTSGSALGSGSGTSGDLRYCLHQAIYDQQPDTITFDSSVFTGARRKPSPSLRRWSRRNSPTPTVRPPSSSPAPTTSRSTVRSGRTCRGSRSTAAA